MRKTTGELVQHYIQGLDLKGEVLEIGGHKLAKCAIASFPEPRFRYHDLNLSPSDIPNTIVANITDCHREIEAERFDLVFSSDVFEHIDRPWLAAQEISRILKPGGIAITVTLFAWRNHPCPIDYWRYSAECLEFLFKDLTCLEKGYDLSERRDDKRGNWKSGRDAVPIDSFGGFRENWGVYHVGRKGGGSSLVQYKKSDLPNANYCRQDNQEAGEKPSKPDALKLHQRLYHLKRAVFG